MEDKIKLAVCERFEDNVRFVDYEEGTKCYYLRFLHNSTFKIARLSKISKRIDIYNAEECIYVD